MRVHYIAQYANCEDVGKEYLFSPGGISKMNYFLYSLSQLHVSTRVFSLCRHGQRGFKGRRHGTTPFGQPVAYACSLNLNVRLSGFIANVFAQIQLFFYLLSLSAKNDTVLFYHERFYAPIFKMIRKIKKLNIICDIEELYTVHAQYASKVIEQEKRYLRSFDRYIVATSELIPAIGIKGKPCVVCNGVYAPILAGESPKDTSCIRVLYAGTFDKTKGGVYAAISAFKYLDTKFRLIVCGWGNQEEVSLVQSMAREVNTEKGEEQITYRGFVPNTSQEYRDLLLSSHIGLSTQNPEGDYNTTSFPSKIFEYMRYGLIVVSTPLKVVETLPIARCVTTIQPYSPQGIAEAIRKASVETPQSQFHFLQEMHRLFLQKMHNQLL